MRTTEDLHTLTGAYALHALGEDERAAFQRHMKNCPPCAQEVAEFSATATRLGLAVSDAPRLASREQVLRRISGVRQEPPRTDEPVRSRWTVAVRARRASQWALAACVAAVAAFGGLAAWQQDQADQARTRAERAEARAEGITAVLAAPDARTTTARLADGASATVVVSRSLNQGVFVPAGMGRPPSGKVYQLWLDDHGTMRSAGLMDPDRPGQAVLLRGPVEKASGLGITVEPAGGSARPTSAPIALVTLPV
ncbi:anti-sigma factor [Streptomyces sp. DH24]|uniref:anti-sigma factor n=1 Tax=Streptomyces sp. DH24 TaxID=3040123 RepID=UPI002441092F|nr:anti-sigma factor [Streptomyces sp. DH24]MDG9715717.1 anti-sigma factor [Streptomyces sp. DH24]